MAKTVDAVTKAWQCENTIRRILEKALGRGIQSLTIDTPGGGFFSAVYVAQADSERYVIKLAQGDGVKTMRHEKDYIQTEAKMLITLRDLPFPKPRLVFFDDSLTVCETPYFVMTHLPGIPMSEAKGLTQAELYRIRYRMGVITSQICAISCDAFGIPAMPETYTDKNSVFVYGLFRMLLEDAREKDIAIPEIGAAELLALIRSFARQLNTCARPVLAHTDTWPGNILLQDGEFCGLIDYAAILYGDPLISHDFHDFGDAPTEAFLRGFGKSAFTDEERVRIQIYRVWQRLGMIVERGYRAYADPNQYAWVIGEYAASARELKRMADEQRV